MNEMHNDAGERQEDPKNIEGTDINCILKILHETYENLKISLIIPKILENYDEVKQLLIGTKYEQFLDVLDNCMKRRAWLLSNRSTKLMDPLLLKIVDFMHQNNAMFDLLPEWKNHLLLDDIKLLRSVEMLCKLAFSHLSLKSKDIISKEYKIHHMNNELEALNSMIKGTRGKVHSQKINLRWKMSAKMAVLCQFEDDLMLKKYQNQLLMQNELNNYSRHVRENRKLNLECMVKVEEQLEKAELEHNNLNRVQSKELREARAEKNKVLLQLNGQIKKYDQVIFEKFLEEVTLREELKEAKKQLQEYMRIYRTEEAIYREVVVSREEEEKRQRQRRIVTFVLNRAAKKIQRWWRKWLRHNRKKQKRLKKKKR